VSKNKFSRNWKVHLFFGGGLLLAFAINVSISFFSGQTLLRATLDAFRQIRPVEYIMFILFWYWFARGQQPNSRPKFTGLNLGGSKT
jgi:hypothetical protein